MTSAAAMLVTLTCIARIDIVSDLHIKDDRRHDDAANQTSKPKRVDGAFAAISYRYAVVGRFSTRREIRSYGFAGVKVGGAAPRLEPWMEVCSLQLLDRQFGNVWRADQPAEVSRRNPS